MENRTSANGTLVPFGAAQDDDPEGERTYYEEKRRRVWDSGHVRHRVKGWREKRRETREERRKAKAASEAPKLGMPGILAATFSGVKAVERMSREDRRKNRLATYHEIRVLARTGIIAGTFFFVTLLYSRALWFVWVAL